MCIQPKIVPCSFFVFSLSLKRKGLIVYNFMEIIHLVLYSESEDYNQIYKLTREYYKQFPKIKTIYYKFDETILQEFELRSDILHIRGKETYVPVDKTIKAFQYMDHHYAFDYLVRSNISTIVNFDRLTPFLNNQDLDYGGGLKNILRNIDRTAGIVDTTYFGIEYASGTSIILSSVTIKHIIYNTDRIKFNLIDDVAIGLFIREHTNAIVKYTPSTSFLYVDTFMCDDSYIFYRNRHKNRETDIIHIEIILDWLKSNKVP